MSYSTEFADIEHVSDYLMVTWKKFADYEQFRSIIDKEAELSEEYGVHKILVDARKFRGTSWENRQYVNDRFEELAEKRGQETVRYLVVGDDATGRFSLNRIVSGSKGKGKNYKFFNSVEEAKEAIGK